MIELNKQCAPKITEEDMHAMSASQLRGLLHLCNAQLSAMRAAPVYLSWVKLRSRCITETIQRSEQDAVYPIKNRSGCRCSAPDDEQSEPDAICTITANTGEVA